MAQLNFDASQHDPQQGFDPVPAGKYTAMITSSEMKPTKKQNGEYLSLMFQIIDGEFNGRIVFANLTLSHPNKTTVDIANSTLSAICHAVGIMNVQDSQELHDKPMVIDVRVSVDEKYGDRNEIKKYESCDGGQPTVVPRTQASASSQTNGAATQAAAAPWETAA